MNSELLRRAAHLILKHQNDRITIVSHMDTDGICAAAIISKALDRLNVERHVKFVNMLYRDVVDQISPTELIIFTDLGSSQLENVRGKFGDRDVIIIDHHEPEGESSWPGLVQLNAHFFGMDGAHEISGAGMAYLLARELGANDDLSALAIVGAVGDVQNAWGKLVGRNREIAQEGISSGWLEGKTDLLLYGRYSRPIFKALELFSDPFIPGVTNSTEGCISMLKDLGIPQRGEQGWRRPVDLTDEEKKRLATELIARAFMHVPPELAVYVPNLVIGEAYSLQRESEASMLKDVNEFATLLNSTARNEQPLIGLEVAKGDRGVYYRAMLNLLRHHRRSIARGMEFVKQNGLQRTPGGRIQYFDATGVIKETFVGTVAGLALGHPVCDPYLPIVGIVRTHGLAKISARCSKLLFLKGLNMAASIRGAAEAVGGEGGGHAIACGAQVEEERVEDFLREFEARLIS